MATNAKSTEELNEERRKAELEARVTAAEATAKATNDSRSGKGTRVAVGLTRGRNPQVITWEAFDESLSDTLPKSLSEFMSLAKVEDETVIVGYLIGGFNSAAQTAASDPTSEYVDKSWPDDVQKQFKTVVKNYSLATGVSIEDAVALIKPGIVAAVAKSAKPVAV